MELIFVSKYIMKLFAMKITAKDDGDAAAIWGSSWALGGQQYGHK